MSVCITHSRKFDGNLFRVWIVGLIWFHSLLSQHWIIILLYWCILLEPFALCVEDKYFDLDISLFSLNPFFVRTFKLFLFTWMNLLITYFEWKTTCQSKIQTLSLSNYQEFPIECSQQRFKTPKTIHCIRFLDHSQLPLFRITSPPSLIPFHVISFKKTKSISNLTYTPSSSSFSLLVLRSLYFLSLIIQYPFSGHLLRIIKIAHTRHKLRQVLMSNFVEGPRTQHNSAYFLSALQRFLLYGQIALFDPIV